MDIVFQNKFLVENKTSVGSRAVVPDVGISLPSTVAMSPSM
jgi:hypothetical protein